MTSDEKIIELEERISKLENEVQVLNTWRQKHIDKVRNKKMQDNLNTETIIDQTARSSPEPAVNTHTAEYPKPEAKSSFTAKAIVNNPGRPRSNHGKTKEKTDLESFVGKKVFTIVASVLIFIGVIVFAGTLFPYLNEEMKFIAMCLASLGFTIFAYMYNQKKNSTYSNALLACGLGTIYITLLTGALYFKFINNIVLYTGLIMWCYAVFCCSRYKTLLFNIIGQSGILISLIIGVANAISKDDSTVIIISVLYIITAEILYNILFKDDKYMINTLSIFISVLILSIPVIRVYDPEIPALTRISISGILSESPVKIALLALLICLFGYAVVKNIILTKHDRLSETKYSIVTLVSLGTFILAIEQFKTDVLTSTALLIYTVISLCITERLFYDEERNAANIVSCIEYGLVIIMYYQIFFIDLKSNILISGFVLVFPVMYYIYMTDTKLHKAVLIVGVCLNAVMNFFYATAGSDSRFIIAKKTADEYYSDTSIWSMTNIFYYVSLIVLTVILYLCFRHHIKGKTWAQILAYLVIVSNIVLSFTCMSPYSEYGFENHAVKDVNAYFNSIRLITLILMLIIQLWFYRNDFFEKQEHIFKQGTFITYFIINALFMLTAINMLYDMEDFKIEYLFASILTVTLFTLNTAILLIEKNTTLGIYVDIKIAFLIFAIMHVFESQPFVSVILFSWAVICIILGFKNEQKYMRICALIIALISSVKLILIDISYTNGLLRAASFMICGILCFIIGYIYYRVEKINTRSESKQDQ